MVHLDNGVELSKRVELDEVVDLNQPAWHSSCRYGATYRSDGGMRAWKTR